MIRYHTSCATISIYSFDKISETNDLKHMVIGWDEYEEIDIDQEKADELWKEIFNEYIVLSNDNKISMYYETVQELSNLKTRKHIVSIILDRILENEKVLDDYIAILRTLGFYVNKANPLIDEVKKLRNQLRAADNKIRLTEDKLKTLKDSGESMPLMKQVIKLEQALGKNMIDPRTTSVERWLFMYEEAKESNKKSA